MRVALLMVVTLMLGADPVASCSPEQMVKVVFRNATPGLDTESFASEPKTLYRYGSHHARLEEALNPETGIHGLIVVNQRDTWMVNLVTGTGQHIVDTAESYDFHAPIVGGPDDPPGVLQLEFGCEIEFMKQRGLEPKPVTVADLDLLEYETIVEGYEFRLLVVPEREVPFAFALYENDALVYALRYLEYAADLPPEPALFAKPQGIEFQEPQ